VTQLAKTVRLHGILCAFVPLVLGCRLCEREAVAQTSSPSGNTKALVFLMNCGATTSYPLHVGLLKPGETLNEAGIGVFIAEDTLDSVGLPDLPAGAVLRSVVAERASDTQLVIRYDGSAKISRQKERFRGISITSNPHSR
jgi:hypothetical protein